MAAAEPKFAAASTEFGTTIEKKCRKGQGVTTERIFTSEPSFERNRCFKVESK